jgi:hypothetical protein
MHFDAEMIGIFTVQAEVPASWQYCLGNQVDLPGASQRLSDYSTFASELW